MRGAELQRGGLGFGGYMTDGTSLSLFLSHAFTVRPGAGHQRRTSVRHSAAMQARTGTKHLTKSLLFPFDAEVYDAEPGPVQIGDRVSVKGISGEDDLCGIIVAGKLGRRRYDLALCDLEVADAQSANHQVVDDYRTWFGNR